MSIFFSYNGRFYKQGTPVISADNRSLKFGDGLFETMKMVNGKLELKEYHFERLLKGMQILGFDFPLDFTQAFFEKGIAALVKKNNGDKSSRIRLTVFRGDGSLNGPQDHHPNYIIQTWPLPDVINLNTSGLIIDIYPHVKKSIDILSNLKTNNFLPYVLAANHAQKNDLSDCILLNTNGRICDTTVANIFIIKDKIVFTPSLTEGCVAGVMRRWVIEKMQQSGIKIKEKSLTVEEVKQSDEIFLTNSVFHMRWVKQFQGFRYTNKQTKILYSILKGEFK